MDVVGWFLDPANWSGANGVPTRLLEHLWISGISVAIATAFGLPLGLWIGHTGRFANVAINLANIGRAIPSYGMLAMVLPISLSLAPVLGYSPRDGLRLVPTLVAMTLLAVPPIVVNTWAGLRAVDRDLVEAARGQGLRERQILQGIELPLASSVIIGGFRTAALQVIATATIAAIVSYGGLGRYIIDGIAINDLERIVAGAILVAALALTVDGALALLQRAVMPRGLRQVPTRDVSESAQLEPAAGTTA
jgi:osmoprotectant transport system permease protein